MLESLQNNTDRNLFRFTVIRDGNYAVTANVLEDFQDICDFVLTSRNNRGLGPSINSALSHINSVSRWDPVQESLTCYVQDDVIFQKGWLEKLASRFLQFERPLNLAFATGHDAVEHRDDPRAERKQISQDSYTSKYIRATCMMARQSTWMSMWPIPMVDPETGMQRGRPHDGLGSGVDWHFIRVHPQSVVRTNRTNLVIPGLVAHAGFDKSTWLKRELPESDADKAFLK